MDGWWPCAPGNVTVMHRARPTALDWKIPGYAHAGVRRSWGKCAIAFPSPTASASKGPAGLTLEPFSWMDHFVRPLQQGLGNRQPERLGRLEVDDQLELRRLFHGKVGGLGAFEDFVHVGSGAPELSDEIDSVRQQQSGLGVLPEKVDAGQPMLHRQVSDLLPARPGHTATEDQKRARAASGHRNEGALDVSGGGGECGQPVRVERGVASIDHEMPPFHVAQLTESFLERPQGWGVSRPSIGEETKPVHLPRRLRLGHERRSKERRTRASKERAPVHHWMTSSARCRSAGGIVRPRALALLRLITNSNFVGCSTGRSPGLAPLRILST